MNNKALFSLSYGLFVLSSVDGEKYNGCIINTAVQVTSSPTRITIAVNRDNFTCGMIERSGKFNLSVLSEDCPFEVFKHFGFQSGRDTDKFYLYPCAVSDNGIPYIENGACAFLSCEVVSATDLGTHILFLADVTDGEVLSLSKPATYAYYHSNIKPKPAKTAEAATGERWRCSVCGYIHEGALPPDFVCPLCKHPASDFERI